MDNLLSGFSKIFLFFSLFLLLSILLIIMFAGKGNYVEGRTASFNLLVLAIVLYLLVTDIINFNETFGLTIYWIYSSTFPTCLFTTNVIPEFCSYCFKIEYSPLVFILFNLFYSHPEYKGMITWTQFARNSWRW